MAHDEILTADEVRHLIEACSPKASTGLRNRAVIAVLYRCGLRVSELLQLEPDDVALDEAKVRVEKRTLGLDPDAAEMVKAWRARRRDLALDGGPLFCTLQGGALSSSYLRALLSRLGRKANIGKQVSAETLRRTLACELASEGVPLALIQAQLGHRSAATTERYLARAAPDALQDTMRRRTQWLAGIGSVVSLATVLKLVWSALD